MRCKLKGQERLKLLAEDMVNSSIQKGTRDRYKKHFEEWKDFVEQFLVNQDFIADSYLQGLDSPSVYWHF